MSDIIATSRQTRFDPANINVTEIDLHDVSISIGKTDVLKDARLRLKSGMRYGLVGPNGSGKSTLFQAIVDKVIPGIPAGMTIHIVSQLETPSEGGDSSGSALSRVLKGHVELTAALREKELLSKAIEGDSRESRHLVGEVLLQRAKKHLEESQRIALLRSGARGKAARADEIASEQAVDELQQRVEKMSVQDAHDQAGALLVEVEAILELLESDKLEEKATRILLGLGFSESMISGPFSALSGGWRSRCRLATALLVPTDLLLLDEPSNFMDLESILWLEQHLLASTTYATLVLTSHDRVFLDRLAEQTIALRESRLDYFDGSPSLMERTEREERRAKEKVVAAMDKKREHIESSIRNGRKLAKATNDDSRMRAVKSREKKLENRWGLETSAKGTRFKLNRDLAGYHTQARAEITLEQEERETVWKIPPPTEIRGSLVTMENVNLGYKSQKIIVGDVSLVVHPGARLAIVGSNGQGKSTLAKAIIGELKPLKGHATDVLSRIPDRTALVHVVETFDFDEQTARKHLASLGLAGKVVSHTRIANLSGGQKVRLALVIILATSPNLLVLDEVTTHLDAASIRAFARALAAYEGAVILITHDRWFSSVVVDRQPIDADDEVDAVEEEEETKEPGETILIRKGKCKRISGMEEYERIMMKRINKRLKEQSA